MKKYKLRKYQQEAIDAILKDTSGLNNIVVLPTGAGKSLVVAEVAPMLAELLQKLNTKIIILQPSIEILEQNKKKLVEYIDPIDVGVFSASAGEKNIEKYTLATIGSIYKLWELFLDVDTIIIDECHTVNTKKSQSMYMDFIKNIQQKTGRKIRVIGLSATPYRLDKSLKFVGGRVVSAITTTKILCRTMPRFWNNIIYNRSIKQMIDDKYLVPVKYNIINPEKELPINKSGSDYDLEKWSEMSKTERIAAVIKSLKGKHILVFCSSVNQAKYYSERIESSDYVDCTQKDRSEKIQNFRDGKIKVMFNVEVMTTGFDFPEIDTIVLLRPTRSMALYLQMVGRGLRISDGKERCELVDLCKCVEKNGTIESVELRYLGEYMEWHRWDLFSDVWKDGINGKALYETKIINKGSKK